MAFFCFLLRCLFQGWPPWVLFVLLFLWCKVSSLSWYLMTRNRMYLIISVKAVFILIWPLLMPNILPFLFRAWKHSNYLIAFYLSFAGFELYWSQSWTCRQKTKTALKNFPPRVYIILPFSYKMRKIKKMPSLHSLPIRSELFKRNCHLKFGIYTMYRNTCIYFSCKSWIKNGIIFRTSKIFFKF